MNVNGSRFELLLGRDDWGRCLDGDGAAARPLSASWPGALVSPAPIPDPALPAWDEARQELILAQREIELPDTPSEQPFSLSARRAASADRNGNVYRIGDNRTTLVVFSAGSRRESVFWPARPASCDDQRRAADFEPAQPAADASGDTYFALATTADDYLVVAFARGARRGLLAFDLVAGGEPVATWWPQASAPFEPFDMAPRCGGGVWVLDRANARLWELDARLVVVSMAQRAQELAAAQLDDFQPLAGGAREHAAVTFPGGIDLAGSPAWVHEAIAIEMLGEGRVLLLDVDAGSGRSRVVRLQRVDGQWSADASAWLEMPDTAHDFVLGGVRLYHQGVAAQQLLVASAGGNQVRAYAVFDSPEAFTLRATTDLFPLRRFGGRALVAIKGAGHYDSGVQSVLWTPIVQEPRALYRASAVLVTPVLDSGEIGTTWDRVVLDACLPPGTAVSFESRTGDELEDFAAFSPQAPLQVAGAWRPEPAPILRGNGPELPWLRAEAARATRRENGVGAWELLLQDAHGRYLQLRIRLTSLTEMVTPRLRALRAWSPRFSYPRRFLPAVYREDATAAPFLERWLANIESTLTNVEDRVVHLQALFDARIAPAETLAWLASWFDVAFDPAWDEARQRLFIERAMDYFQWRGTVHGLRLALALAFDPCIDRHAFDGPAAIEDGPRAIRVVETYQTRLLGSIAAGDPGGTQPGPRVVTLDALWNPDEGNAGLVERYVRSRGDEPTPKQLTTPFALVPPADTDEANAWAAFTRAVLGFTPSIGAAERALWGNFLLARHGTGADAALPRDRPGDEDDASEWAEFSKGADGAWLRGRWHDFLARRYRRIERLNRTWQTHWSDFDVVALPDALPETAAAQRDWLQFEGQALPMHHTAHRFSVLLPLADVSFDPAELLRRLGLARRIVELEKPAHAVFDVRFFWAFFRIGEARLGIDTQLGQGSRAKELIPEAVLGLAYTGASFVAGAARPKAGDRLLTAC